MVRLRGLALLPKASHPVLPPRQILYVVDARPPSGRPPTLCFFEESEKALKERLLRLRIIGQPAQHV
jgi:hypothetical protein